MQLFLNNWSAALLGDALEGDLTMSVDPDQAAMLAGLGSGDHYVITALESLGSSEISREIIKVTGVLGGDLTIVREQEGTAARYWPAGTALEMRLTAAALEGLRPAPGDGSSAAARFGSPRLPVGSMVCPFELTSAGNTSYSNSYIYLVPFEPDYPIEVDRLGVRIQVANASASIRVALYSAAAEGWPDARIDMVTIPAASAGHQTAALDAPRALEVGQLYWFAIQPVGAAVNMINVNSRPVGMASTGVSARILKRFTGAAPPFTWGFDVGDFSSAIDAAPFVSIRRSA
ncbi:hypothetical protein [Pseudomonas sp.]|uniref:hypothetical protein n=1 Tax=Pseudomonas sp. TaxID=306 RepID=UPI00272F1EB1|nr:hypothetical protein [Pseudomonas sp.]MDP2244008.1 hypothetical protein [Pseudomonas sp.]